MEVLTCVSSGWDWVVFCCSASTFCQTDFAALARLLLVQIPKRDQAMSDRQLEAIRHLPRADLEAFAVRLALHVASNRREIEHGNLFLTLLIGFLLGVLVAASGLFLGLRLA